MLRKNVALTMGALALAVLAAGCAKVPQQALDAASAAMNGADAAEAPKYADAEWSAAQEAMNAAQAEIQVQNEKFALFRSYKKAEELIATAQGAADQAREAAVAGKERARMEAESALGTAQASLDRAAALLTELGGCRRKPKGFAADMEVLKGNLDGLTGQVASIQSAIDAEDFFGAKAQADVLNGQADTLAGDLESAKTKIGC